MKNIKRKITPSNEEVYFPSEDTLTKKVRDTSKGRPRKVYYTNPEIIKEQNKEHQNNLYYAESKIRTQIQNDKMIHQALKNGQNLKESGDLCNILIARTGMNTHCSMKMIEKAEKSLNNFLEIEKYLKQKKYQHSRRFNSINNSDHLY